MKILFVQYFAGIGGSERYLLELIPALQATGVECEHLNIFLHANAEKAHAYGEMLTQKGIRVHNQPISSTINPRILFQINRIYRAGGFDAAHTHMIHADLWCSLAKRAFNRKMVIFSTKHGYTEEVYITHALTPENIPKNAYYRTFQLSEPGIDKSYACSYGLRDFYERGGLVSSGQFEVVEHGFDYPEPPAQRDPAYRLGDPQLVIVGRLAPVKGHSLVFQVLPGLVRRFPGLKLALVGRGNHESALRDEAKSLGIEDNVEFLGFQTDVLEWSFNSDIVLVPSYCESMPLVVLEGFNSLRPVVAFDTIGCRDIIENGKDGILVPPYNLEILEEKLLGLLEDPSERDRLAQHAFTKLKQQYSLNRMVSETRAFYEKHLGQHKAVASH